MKISQFMCVILGMALLQPNFLIGADKSKVLTSRKEAKELLVPSEEDSFSFVVFGDRTDGETSGLAILSQAIEEVNSIRPDFVFTVGDHIQGNTTRRPWLTQMKQYQSVMSKLQVPWYPVAGNHDIYWVGPRKPYEEHEADFEKHFGPLWYSFKHKNCLFVVLYTDEGNPETGERTFKKASSQGMSEEQKTWLRNTLKKNKDVNHVFVFQHHPRWRYESGKKEWDYGEDWKNVHRILKDFGPVSAVFAGHCHEMNYDGEHNGIKYYVMGITGAGAEVETGWRDLTVHQYALVTVRGENFYITMIPVGFVFNPEKPSLFPHEMILLHEHSFYFKSEETRHHKYILPVPNITSPKLMLRIHIYDSHDNSGDQGMTYRILDSAGRELKASLISSKGWVPIELNVEPGASYHLIIEDLDTVFVGEYPGNAIRLKAILYY